MKTALHRFGLPTGIALAVLALVACPQRWSVATAGAVIPIGSAANPDLADSSAKPESRDDKSSPANQFLTAYKSMSLADWLNEKGMSAEATDLYTEAQDLFGKLAVDYPQWQPAVVSFRINYCREALARLQGIGEREATPDGSGGEEKQTPNAQRPTPNAESKTKNEEPGTKNKSQETSNAATLSPLNFKLQQAALRERGRDYTGAFAMYIALLEEYPREPWALKGAGRCCLRLKRINMARALIQQALALPSPDADTNLLAALIECNDGRYQEALALLRQSLKQNGACPEAHAALGVALTATGKMKEAQEEMKRALSLNPKLSDAYYNLARLSLRQKSADRDTARVHYQNALRYGAVADPELDALLAE